MQEVSKKSASSFSDRFKLNFNGQRFKQIRYCRKSLIVLGPILWNSLPKHFKEYDSLYKFKKLISKWGSNDCPYYAKFRSYITAVR